MNCAKTIPLTALAGLGLALLGGLACRSVDKIEATQPASVSRVTAIEPPAAAAPIQFHNVKPSEVATRQAVVENDDLKICEVIGMSGRPVGKYRIENGQWKPVLTNEYGEPLPEIIMDIEILDDDYSLNRFAKPGAHFSPDIIHRQTWKDRRESVLLASPTGM